MNTILTDDEIHKWWASENGMEDADMAKLNDFREVTRKVEAAVLAKLAAQEPAINYAVIDEYVRDKGVNYNEVCRIVRAAIAAPLPAVVQVPQGWRDTLLEIKANAGSPESVYRITTAALAQLDSLGGGE